MKKLIVAICYDFDKTLASNDMQSFSFIPNLKMEPEQFWQKAERFRRKTKCDPVLAYLQTMLSEASKHNIVLTKEYLTNMGKNIKFYDGVTTWFSRLNNYAQKLGITLEHYIISSGNKEIIDGCKIAKEFTGVFGCEFLFDKSGKAYWPKNLVNYTQKTQYLFRISKGSTDLSDSEMVNKRVSKKHVEFRNMIYIGDGVTDIPCMTLVKEKGGNAISVYTTSQKNSSISLLQDNRVNYACKSDFKSNSPLEKLVKLILDSLALKDKLITKEQNKKLK